MLPSDWRRQMAEVVRGAEDPDPDWFAGGVVLSPSEQIEVYRGQYRLRLVGALRTEVPGLAAVLGDRTDDLLLAYLAEHPSQSYTLNRIADRLVDWLRAQKASQLAIDMAMLDRAVMEGFEAAAGQSLQPEQLTTTPRLQLQPHVRLIAVSHEVHLLRSAVIQDKDALPEAEAREVQLVVFRRNLKMRHLEVVPSCWLVLKAFEDGAGLGEALEEAVAAGADPEVLEARLLDWFKLFAERDLLQAAV